MPTFYDMIIVNNSTFDMNCILHLVIPGASNVISTVWWSHTIPAGEKETHSFDASLCVVLAEKEKNIFSEIQKVNTEKQTAWQVAITGESTVITPGPSSSHPKYGNEIRVENRSGSLRTIGIGMNDVGALFQERILSGANTSFNMMPEYRLAVLNEGVDAPVGKEVQTREDSGTESAPVVRQADMRARKVLSFDPLYFTHVTLEESDEGVSIKSTSIPKS